MLRIYTEDVNRRGTEGLLHHLEAYTLFVGRGIWPNKLGRELLRRVTENSLVIETTDRPREAVLFLVREIKHLNRQETVLVVHIENTAEFSEH